MQMFSAHNTSSRSSEKYVVRCLCKMLCVVCWGCARAMCTVFQQKQKKRRKNLFCIYSRVRNTRNQLVLQANEPKSFVFCTRFSFDLPFARSISRVLLSSTSKVFHVVAASLNSIDDGGMSEFQDHSTLDFINLSTGSTLTTRLKKVSLTREARAKI